MVAVMVALMFVGLILTDFAVQKYRVWRIARATGPVEDADSSALQGLWQLPEGLTLSNAHTWLRSSPGIGVEVGADAFVLHALGAVREVVLPRPGDQVSAGQALFRLVRDRRSITVPSAITGKVSAANTRLTNDPGLLKCDPYGRGWICRITPTATPAEPNVRLGDKAALWLEDEFLRLREFLSGQVPTGLALGATSQDGGLPSSGCLAELNETGWTEFEKQFLNR